MHDGDGAGGQRVVPKEKTYLGVFLMTGGKNGTSLEVANDDRMSPINYSDMSGGKYYVPDDEQVWRGFCHAVAQSAVRGERYYLSEMIPRNHLRRFAIDLDLRVSEDGPGLTPVQQLAVVLEIQHVLRTCYPETGKPVAPDRARSFALTPELVASAVAGPASAETPAKVKSRAPVADLTLHVLCAPPKHIPKHGQVGIGLHVHSALVVSYEQAVQLTCTLQLHLDNVFGDGTAAFGSKLLSPWNKVIDPDIHSGGLRLFAARKAESCRSCKRFSPDPCPLPKPCTKGVLDTGRPYCYWVTLTHNGTLDRGHVERKVRGNLTWAVSTFCMRLLHPERHAPTLGFELPAWARGPATKVGLLAAAASSSSSKANKKKKKKNKRGQRGGHQVTRTDGSVVDEDTKTMTKEFRQRVYLARESDEYNTVVELFRKHRHEKHVSVTVKDVMTNTKRTYYVVVVAGVEAGFCLNKQDYHSSNRVFYQVNRNRSAGKGLHAFTFHQRCHSSKCDRYASPRTPATVLSINDRKRLFPLRPNLPAASAPKKPSFQDLSVPAAQQPVVAAGAVGSTKLSPKPASLVTVEMFVKPDDPDWTNVYERHKLGVFPTSSSSSARTTTTKGKKRKRDAAAGPNEQQRQKKKTKTTPETKKKPTKNKKKAVPMFI